MRYILASASPRRKELLALTGIDFEIIPSSIEEKITKNTPCDVVMELAFQKAEDVYRSISSTDDGDITVIGADTIVAYNDEILGKPADKEEAYDMLSLLSDRTHQVYTGVSIIRKEDGARSQRTFYEKTDVAFYPINRQDLHDYVESGDPLDKAGAYGIQGSFAVHVKEIRGEYSNVVGLPVGRLYHELGLCAASYNAVIL